MKAGKYARIERERRYQLLQLPADLPAGAPYHLICDRYLTGTRLRLRQITALTARASRRPNLHLPGRM